VGAGVKVNYRASIPSSGRSEMWITPYHQETDFSFPLEFDSKVQIFVEQTLGWQLNIAEEVIENVRHSGFAVLSIVMSYFEKIGKYRSGFADMGKSRHYFKEGAYFVFPSLRDISPDIVNKLLDAIYEGCRCGLYHSGLTNSEIIITGDFGEPIGLDPDQKKLIVNPHMLIPELKSHLKGYETQLRNPENVEIRQKFEHKFDYDWT
jgi:hypothetical protein